MTTPPGPVPTGPPLTGRERELAALREALAAALAGRGSLVLIGGEAGLGKTALAEATLAEATDQGALVLVGRCYDLAETPPYGPWVEALSGWGTGEGLPPLPTALLPPERDGEALTGQDAIVRRALAYLAALAATRPVVLLLDDLHWADPASLDLLRVLARGLATLPLLVLATYRADEVGRGQPLFALLPLLAREARALRLDLRPLDAAAIAALVTVRYPLPATDRARLIAYLAGRTEGNALFLGELLRTLEGEGVLRQADGGWDLGDLAAVPVPALLHQVIAGRLHRLPPETERLLTIAAAIGQEVPLALWAAVAELDERALLDHAAHAVDARMLTETPDGAGVRFAHALIREALYAGTSALLRRGLHRRAGEALAAAPNPDPDAVAYQFQRAGDARAADWLIRAGERAWRAFALLTAADRYEAALALLESGGADAGARGWLTFRLALTRRVDDPRRALGDIEEAARLANEAGDRFLAGLATFLAGHTRGMLGYSQRGLAQMVAGLDALDALPPAERVPPGTTAPFDPALQRGGLINWLANHGPYAEAVATGERYLATTPSVAAPTWLGGNPYADAHQGLGVAYAGLGQPERARAALARAVESQRAIGNYRLAGSAAFDALQAALAYQADRPTEWRHLAGETEEAWRQASGSAQAPFPVRVARLPVLVLEGQWAEARAVAEQARGTAVEGWATPTLAWLAREQGDPALARSLLLGWLPEGPQTAPGQADAMEGRLLLRLAAALALDAAALDEAHAWLDAHDRWLAWSGAVLGQAEGQLGWAEHHRAAGDLALAREPAARALAHATEPRQPLALLATHRLLGEIDTAAGHHAAAAAHLDAALALADACAAPYERALTLLALAELRQGAGSRDEAQAPLDEARALLEPLGARPALARAAALGARLAAPPAPPAHAHPAGLTAREVAVLRLVAQGLTNAQVAERLFLSPRTVNAYLTTIYTKLGVASRNAATRFAVEHGLG